MSKIKCKKKSKNPKKEFKMMKQFIHFLIKKKLYLTLPKKNQKILLQKMKDHF